MAPCANEFVVFSLAKCVLFVFLILFLHRQCVSSEFATEKTKSNHRLETSVTSSGRRPKSYDSEDSGWGLPDRPIQLVRPDPQHKQLVIIEENVKLLHKIRGTVATVAVVGKFHSGKSFLMNQLMGKSAGFGIGFSVRPQTMGIWMWGKPLQMTLPSSKKVNVIFLDTEGFAANNISETYDAKIFAVATLLSSHLIYNSVKIIDQADIDYLELLSRRTQLFALSSQMSKAKWKEFNHDLLTFPPLLWVVQDFVQQKEEGQTSKDWLHQIMETRNRESEEYEISLLGIFKSVDCHTLFLPATNKRLLTDLSQAREDDLTDDYRIERDELKEKLRHDLVPKEKNHVPITGPELASLVEILVLAANDGSLAEVPSRWNVFVKRLEETSVEDCYRFYVGEMEALKEKYSDGPVPPEQLQTWHDQAATSSMNLLEQLLFGLKESVDKALERLQSAIDSEYARVVDMNDKKIRLRCTEVQSKVELVIDEKLGQLVLPAKTETINQLASQLLNKSIRKFSADIEGLVSDDVIRAHSSSIQNFVKTASDSVILRNKRLLENVLEEATNQVLNIFREKTQNPNRTPWHPKVLTTMSHEATKHSLSEFVKAASLAKDEQMYGAYFALCETKLEEATKELHKSNEAFVVADAEKLIRDLHSRFIDATSNSKIVLPMNESDLNDRLERETLRMVSVYAERMEPFTSYSAYETTLRKLKTSLKEVWKQRRQENMDAYTREIEGPLNNSKRIVLLSADKFYTPFSLKQYIIKICLVTLNEGKAQYWSEDWKRTIVNRFIETNDELSSLIQSRQNWWSSIVGFWEWLLMVLAGGD